VLKFAVILVLELFVSNKYVYLEFTVLTWLFLCH